MNIVITWPKSRSLESYLIELDKADKAGEFINFRLPTKPKEHEVSLCYIVHDGAIRGWNDVVSIDYRPEGVVRDPITGDYWPAGFYVVRDPHWHPLKDPIPMKGFQGFRYYEEDMARV